MKNKYFENGELKDEQIYNALLQAADTYKKGDILDVWDELQKIINAIKKYEQYERR